MQNFDDLARYRDRVRGRSRAARTWAPCPGAAKCSSGERSTSRTSTSLDRRVSEGQRIAHLAAAFDAFIAPHDWTGPVHADRRRPHAGGGANALHRGTVRSDTSGFYREIVDRMPAIESGFIRPLEGPGLGAALSPDLLARSDARVRLSGVRSAYDGRRGRPDALRAARRRVRLPRAFDGDQLTSAARRRGTRAAAGRADDTAPRCAGSASSAWWPCSRSSTASTTAHARRHAADRRRRARRRRTVLGAHADAELQR